MVANEGVMDLLLNFMCSAEQAEVDVSSVVVFVGDQKYVKLIENMGANAMYHPALGSMPAHAARGYLDDTFARMMWFKTTSVYLALHSGFEVLFQDVDLVWMKGKFYALLLCVFITCLLPSLVFSFSPFFSLGQRPFFLF
jgi:hypothetical protein